MIAPRASNTAHRHAATAFLLTWAKGLKANKSGGGGITFFSRASSQNATYHLGGSFLADACECIVLSLTPIRLATSR